MQAVPPHRTSDAAVAAGRRRAAKRLLRLAVAIAAADIPALAKATVVADAAARGAARATTFAVFCDTLVPADDLTAAASAFGVPNAILADIEGDALAARLLAAGCDWLDAACGGAFAAASEAARVKACERMQAMPWQSPAGRFFQLMRDTVMARYYADPRSWRGLALDRPPQPLGFFDAVR